MHALHFESEIFTTIYWLDSWESSTLSKSKIYIFMLSMYIEEGNLSITGFPSMLVYIEK